MKKIFAFVVLSIALIQCSDDRINDCSTPAIVRDLTGFDGCGFVFELTDGTKLEPQRLLHCGTPPLAKEITDDPLYNFEFVDGMHVRLSYTVLDNISACMVGPVVKITCIEEVTILPAHD